MIDFYNMSLFLLILVCLFFINTILGVFLNTTSEKFSIKKFFFGFLKLLIVLVCIILFLFIIEVTPLILSRIGVDVSSDMIKSFEFLSLLFTVYRQYCLDVYDKIKKILNLL